MLNQLLSHGDYGLVDASLALTRVSSLEPAERISHAGAAAEMRALVARGKARDG